MKLLRFGESDHERPGVLLDDWVADVSAKIADFDAVFFAGGGLARLRALVDGGTLPAIERDDVRLGPPIARPGNIICVGLNYADHAAEAGAAVPTEPTVFSKAPNTVIGPHDDLLIPPDSAKTDWEVELGVVIGARARYLSDEGAAAACIAGYVVSHDVSEREFQLERGGQWVKGKSCETFNPLGPWLVTADEIADPQNLELWLSVNGTPRQHSSTKQMIFGVHHLVWYLSQFMVLDPGDLINTGTPAGVGLALDPPCYLHPGDVVTLGIAGLGEQRQTCRQATR